MYVDGLWGCGYLCSVHTFKNKLKNIEENFPFILGHCSSQLTVNSYEKPHLTYDSLHPVTSQISLLFTVYISQSDDTLFIMSATRM
jgi:hypothetical protein